MSLQVWLPLNGDIENRGLLDNFTQGTTPSYTTDGKIGKALTTGSLVMSAEQTASVLNNNEVSFCFWIYPNANTGSSPNNVLLFGTGSMGENNNRKFSIFTYPTVNDLHLSWQNDSANNTFIADVYSNAMPSYKWTHIAITYKNPTCTLYINGENKATYSGTSSSSSFAYQTQLIHNSSNRWLNDFRIYDHCLSAKEVKEISKGLICHYKLDNNGFGNRNLVKGNFNCISTSSTYNASGSLSCILTADDFISNKGKTLTLSCEIYSPGESKSSVTDYRAGRFGIHGSFYYTKTDGTGTQLYPFASLLGLGRTGKRYSESWTIPSDLASVNALTFAIQTSSNDGFACPSDNNKETWWLKNVKLEWGSSPSAYSPANEDTSYSLLGLDSTTESDCSGYKNNGDKIGSVLPLSESCRYSTSTYCNSTNIGTNTPTGAAFIRCTLVNPIINATALTINWWGNIEDYSYQNSGILSLSNNSSYPIDYENSALAQYDSIFRFNLTSGNNSSISSLSLIDTGNWHMYTLVFNNGMVLGYRDGVSVISNSKSGTLAQFKYIYMGINMAGGVYRQTKSKWSDFRIYSTALSASDIKELYSTSASVDKNGNMYAYEFKEE